MVNKKHLYTLQLIEYLVLSGYSRFSEKELKKVDEDFYNALKEEKLLFLLPKTTQWSSMSADELIDYYRKHYEGYSRKDLRRKDPGFYNALKREDLLDKIIPKGLSSLILIVEKIKEESPQLNFEEIKNEVEKRSGRKVADYGLEKILNENA